MKEKNFITNLTKEELERIGQWVTTKSRRSWVDALDAHAGKFNAENIENTVQTGYDTYGYSTEPTLNAFLAYMLDYYKTNYKRPSRATLQYLAWKHGYISNNYLITKWF